MESTPNKIAMEKKDSGAEFEQQDKIKIVRKKNSKNMKNSTKYVHTLQKTKLTCKQTNKQNKQA